MHNKYAKIFIILILAAEYPMTASAACSDWHKKHFDVKKNVITIDNSRNEHLALMMKKRAEIILEDKVTTTLNLSNSWSYYFSSYSLNKGTKKSIDLIFNDRGILLSYKLNKYGVSDFYCLSKSMNL